MDSSDDPQVMVMSTCVALGDNPRDTPMAGSNVKRLSRPTAISCLF